MIVQGQLDCLFDCWRTHLGPAAARFVRDGVMCSERDWAALPLRIEFLLKEAHDRDDVMAKCQHDLVKLWCNPQDYAENRKVAERRVKQWTIDLYQALGAPLPAQDPRQLPCAVVNLSKPAGTSRANDKVLHDAALHQAWFIQEQLRILQPHWVVCGGTLRFINAWGGFEKIGSSGLIFRRQNVYWTNHYHPSYSGAPARHSQVIEALRQAGREGRFRTA